MLVVVVQSVGTLTYLGACRNDMTVHDEGLVRVRVGATLSQLSQKGTGDGRRRVETSAESRQYMPIGNGNPKAWVPLNLRTCAECRPNIIRKLLICHTVTTQAKEKSSQGRACRITSSGKEEQAF
jgi:hypothetical protein